MGNCLSGLAFKPEEVEEEPRYKVTMPKFRKIDQDNIQDFTFDGIEHNKKSSETQTPDEFNTPFEEAVTVCANAFEPILTREEIRNTAIGALLNAGNEMDDEITKSKNVGAKDENIQPLKNQVTGSIKNQHAAEESIFSPKNSLEISDY
ncbi:uncharacterized protein [Chironomus tepperi]|uniref:uncharacterized protein n=1 Tax=Chironomus tepperi TaxID=113505 RepID=UPI00391F809B